ncbi:MAG: hypothetical protein ACR2OZ_20580 [Verrucomicrobiales bacterium]
MNGQLSLRSCALALLVVCLECAAALNAAAAQIELFAGGGEIEQNAPATRCRLIQPFGFEFLPDGSAVIVEMVSSNRVLKVDPAGKLTVIAGGGPKGFSGDGGPARAAAFNGMHNLAISPKGDIFLADTWNYRVRKIDAQTGGITTIAGTGKKGFGGDGGRAVEADFSSIINIALAPSGWHLYVADIENRRVRRIDMASGVVTSVAGDGRKGVPADGAEAKSAPLIDPRAVAPGADGSFYILERSGHALRLVDAAGKIRTVAGTGMPGLGGDGGKAIEAQLNGPKHICLGGDGSVFIADSENHCIRRFDPMSGKIERVAGTGRKGPGIVRGSPLAVALDQPHGVTVGKDGSLYIVDSHNNRILRLVK